MTGFTIVILLSTPFSTPLYVETVLFKNGKIKKGIDPVIITVPPFEVNML